MALLFGADLMVRGALFFVLTLFDLIFTLVPFLGATFVAFGGAEGVCGNCTVIALWARNASGPGTSKDIPETILVFLVMPLNWRN